MNSNVPAILADTDILNAFTDFPAPLILLDADGGAARGNACFLERFSMDGLDAGQRAALIRVPQGGWQEVGLTARNGESTRVQVRAAHTARHVLLFIGTPHADDKAQELEKLRARIDDLSRLAATDHLTGAWNRAHLDRVIESEMTRSLAGRLPVSLVLMDIDHFKRINDTFGHAAGDLVLRELVSLVRSRVRASDLVFRWGGEEFVVLVSAAGHRRAGTVAENLRKAVAEHRFETVGAVTISLGVAEHAGAEDASAWFRRLDEALYEAKESGRNRVVVAHGGSSDEWAAAGASTLQLAWSEGFECGEPVIDEEHRELFRRANLLIEASLRRDAREAILKPLDDLVAHVRQHFADEEAILERLHYDALPEHRRAHAGLVRRAMELAGRLKAGQAGVGAIVEFLAQDVVARHIFMVDRAFFPLFDKTYLSSPRAEAHPHVAGQGPDREGAA